MQYDIPETYHNQEKDYFDFLKMIELLNDHIKNMKFRDSIMNVYYAVEVKNIVRQFIFNRLSRGFNLDINNVWLKYTAGGKDFFDSSNFIITFTLHLDNQYFLSFVYNVKTEKSIILPFHVDTNIVLNI